MNQNEKEAHMDTETEHNSHLENANAIKERFLQYSKKTDLSVSDMKAIQEVAISDIPLQEVLSLIDKAFELHTSKYPGDKINSFTYCKKFILLEQVLKGKSDNVVSE